jgi:peptidoglycan/LPS O-acetylase OafA/YrhL
VDVKSRYVPTLDGWRALSVIGVILFHGRTGFFPEYTAAAKVAARGELGVQVFFAISGFLICGILLRELRSTGTIELRRFYLRRCLRILPPYYAAIVGIVAACFLAAAPVKLADLPSCLFFYRNYLPLGPDYAGGFYTAHFWSLAVEEHFYLFFPLLLLILKPKKAGWAAFLLAALVFVWRHCYPFFFPHSVNYLNHTDTSIDGLLWGCLGAIYFPVIQRYCAGIRFSELWLPVALIVALAEMRHIQALMAFYMILFPALVISTVVQPESLLGRVLEWAPLRWIGGLSYSLYLWQMLFLPEPSMRATGGFATLQRWPWNIFAILLAAIISRYLIELPVMRLGQQLRRANPVPPLPIPIGRGPERKVA